MQTDLPLVSIGVPVFNGAAFVIETLESIRKQIYPSIEIIIVDDGSSDNSYGLCLKWAESCGRKVKVIQNTVNRGTPATSNIILHEANGAYFQLLGQDDILLPEKIAADVRFFNSLPKDTALIFSNVTLIDAEGKATGEDYFKRIGFKGDLTKNILLQLIVQNFIPAASALMRTSSIRSVGGYDETLVYEDWHMWLSLAEKYKVFYNDICEVQYRIHTASVMSNRTRAQVLRTTDANFNMFSKMWDHHQSAEIKKQILLKIKELVVYSFFMGDKNVQEKMRYYLSKDNDPKIVAYSFLNRLGLKHPAKWGKKD